ncbi:hypothetical protein L596_005162 [Steinernema carpocapsae]|uniref:Uncharacterized protein n=1 Tax=Steinernema carpocapsae TaxID=34508 RepID=A0A4V6I8C7_STECR|nr:hypothetical protein L596_005162 [Steinernema carpocapsae]
MSSKQPHIKPDFDTDVLWRPPRMSANQRTISQDSTDMDPERRASVSSMGSEPRRRFSITEMIFGSSPPVGGNMPYQHGVTEATGDEKKSVTKDPRFMEILKHQHQILGE